MGASPKIKKGKMLSPKERKKESKLTKRMKNKSRAYGSKIKSRAATTRRGG